MRARLFDVTDQVQRRDVAPGLRMVGEIEFLLGAHPGRDGKAGVRFGDDAPAVEIDLALLEHVPCAGRGSFW